MTVISQKMFECNIVDCGSFVVVYLRYMGQPLHTLRWHHNEHDGVSNHQPHDWLLNCLFRRRSKKASKLRITGLCEGNSLVTSEFPAQKARNAENVSIWWCNHEILKPEQPWQTRFSNASKKILVFWIMIFLNLFYWYSIPWYWNFARCIDSVSRNKDTLNLVWTYHQLNTKEKTSLKFQ